MEWFGVLAGPGGTVPFDAVYEELPLLIPGGDEAGDRRDNVEPHEGWARFVDASSRVRKLERVRLLGALSTHVSVVVLADPGAGKTTLLRATARSLAREAKRLPLYVHLGRWPEGQDLIEAALCEVAFPPEARIRDMLVAEIEAARDAGRLVVLIDGVDEVGPDRLAALAVRLAAFLRRVDTELHLVIASRPSGDVSRLEQELAASSRPVRCHLAVLNSAQIPRVAERWLKAFGSNASAALLVQQARRTDESFRLSHNPLMLRGMCMLRAAGALELPIELCKLIAQMVKLLTQRGLEAVAHKHGAVPRGALDLVHEEVAGEMVTKGESVLSLELDSYPAALDQVAAKVGKPVGVLLEWVESAGLLTLAGEGSFCFVHRVFEEHFAGRWLARVHGQDVGRLLEWVRAHVIDPDQGSCNREHFETLRWAGAVLPPATTQALVDWLLDNDSVLFEGAILAARVLAMAGDRVVRACAPRLDKRLRELLGTKFWEQALAPWSGGLRAYVARRARVQGLASMAPWQPWLEALGDESEMLSRRAAVIDLETLGAWEHAPDVARLLEDPDPSIRSEVVSALGTLGAWKQAAAIARRLGDEDAGVRRSAVKTLAGLDVREQTSAIATLLRDPDEGVRKAALETLLAFGAREHAATIVEMLRDEKGEVRKVAIQALIELGARSQAEALTALLADTEGEVRAAAARVLGAFGARVQAPNIARLLMHTEGYVREAALEALVAIEAREWAHVITELLLDADDNVSWEAGHALEQLGAVEQAPAVARLLEHDDAGVRRYALGVLGDLGAQQQVPAILVHIEDPSANVRAAAVDAIGVLGAQDQAAAIGARLADPYWGVRSSAARTLARLGDRSHAPAIARALADVNRVVRDAALYALADLGAQEHAPAMAMLLRSDDAWTRRSAIYALRNLGAPDQAAAIAERLRDQYQEVREAAIQALIDLEARDQARAIAELLGESNREVCVAAVKALVALDARDQAPAIARLLGQSGSSVCEAAVEALVKFDARDQAPAMLRLLAEGAPRVRVAAKDALVAFNARDLAPALAKLLDDELQRLEQQRLKAFVTFEDTTSTELPVAETSLNFAESNEMYEGHYVVISEDPFEPSLLGRNLPMEVLVGLEVRDYSCIIARFLDKSLEFWWGERRAPIKALEALHASEHALAIAAVLDDEPEAAFRALRGFGWVRRN